MYILTWNVIRKFLVVLKMVAEGDQVLDDTECRLECRANIGKQAKRERNRVSKSRKLNITVCLNVYELRSGLFASCIFAGTSSLLDSVALTIDG